MRFLPNVHETGSTDCAASNVPVPFEDGTGTFEAAQYVAQAVWCRFGRRRIPSSSQLGMMHAPDAHDMPVSTQLYR